MTTTKPHFTISNGQVNLEWWNGNRKVVAFAPVSVFEAIIVSGPNMHSDMEDTNLEYALEWLEKEPAP